MAKILDISTSRRVYVGTRFGEPVVAKLKTLGAHWDAEQKAWWLGAGKRTEVEALLVSEGAGFNLADPGERAIRTDQLEETGRAEEAAKLRQGAPQQDPDQVRITGKGEYKGRSYYLGAYTRDGARVRCLTLPGQDGRYLDFWADVSAVRVTKTYQPRQVWDGRRYSGRTVEQHTTLGSIAKFIERQRDPRTARGECTECGHHGPRGEACSECGGEGSYV